jgi:hypothetical protein
MFTACQMDGGVDGGDSDDTVVTAFSLDGLVTKPVKDESPDTTAINEAQYTGTIAWQTEGGAAHTGAFAASTVYQAVVTLTAKAGFTFTGVVSDTFTYTGATTVANAADSGTVTITFPATAAEGADTVVNAFSLDGKVKAPVKGAMPNTTAIYEAQYTGTILWQTEGGAAHSGAFAASTVYQAVLTLTTQSGSTFTGVGANTFTCTGAAVANAANSGTVTLVFPKTADTVVTARSLNGKVTAPVKGATPNTTAIHEAQYTGAIAWQTEGGAAHTGAFAASTVYQAVVTLTAQSGYTFTGVVSDTFTYSGAASVANAADSGTVTITFPVTAAEGADTVVNAFSLDGLVTKPVRDAQPDTGAIDTAQYTGTIEWQTDYGVAHTGAFAAATRYRAVVTLTAQSGYTFTGVGGGSFTHTGAEWIFSYTDSAGNRIVDINFQSTGVSSGSAGISITFTGPGNDVNLDGGIKLSKSDSAYSSITISVVNEWYYDGNYDAFRWLVDGADLAGETGNSVTLNAADYTIGAYWLTVIAERAGVPYSRELPFVVMN